MRSMLAGWLWGIMRFTGLQRASTTRGYLLTLIEEDFSGY
jgi:hypothetical protein